MVICNCASVVASELQLKVDESYITKTLYIQPSNSVVNHQRKHAKNHRIPIGNMGVKGIQKHAVALA